MSNTSRRKFLLSAGAATLGIAPFVRAATRTSLKKRLELTTLDNGRVPIDEAALGILKQNLKGRLLTAESKDYEATRQIWNAAIDRKPAMIVQCADASDIAHTIRFARLHKALLSVRAGGHNHVGFAVCDGGVMIDLRNMKDSAVDPDRRIATIQPGLTFADYDAATQKHGLASTGAVVSMVGVPGYTLGGGIGWLHRKTGLGCDSLIGAEVVTAEGEIVRANERENSDLFWAIRGGGGNFGVVSSFQFQLHHITDVLAGLIIHPLEELPKVAAFVRDFVAEAPDDLCVWMFMRKAPASPKLPKSMHGRLVVGIAICYAGSMEKAERVIKPIREFGQPLIELVKVRPYRAWQRGPDGAWGDGFHNEWMSHYLQTISDGAIDTLMDYVSRITSPFSDVKLAHMGGAIARVGENETAFSFRQSEYALVIQTRWKDREESQMHLQWTRDFHQAMHQHGTGKVYVNFVADEGAERVKDAYNSKTFQRLQRIKAKYDPKHIFRMNQNIRPVV